jgi:hypothetical protein
MGQGQGLQLRTIARSARQEGVGELLGEGTTSVYDAVLLQPALVESRMENAGIAVSTENT